MVTEQRNWWWWCITLPAAGCIAWFTLRPDLTNLEGAAEASFLCLFGCGEESTRDAILNVLLFLPLGLGLSMGMPARTAWLLTVLATVTVEFTQYGWLLGREASLRDILTNALGGGLGVALGGNWRAVVAPPPRPSLVLAWSGLVLWLGVVTGSSALSHLSLPSGTYWVEWAPDRGPTNTWRGRVLAARLGPDALTPGRRADADPIRRALGSDSARLAALLIAGSPPQDLASIVALLDRDQNEVLLLSQRHRDLVLQVRTGFRALELGSQRVALRDALPDRSGDTVEVTARVVRGAWELSVTSDTHTTTSRIPFSGGVLWAALLPFRVALDRTTQWGNGLWLASLCFPVGYWLARGTARRAAVAVLVTVALAGLVLAARLAGIEGPPAAEVIGTLSGPLVGWIVGRVSPGCPPVRPAPG